MYPAWLATGLVDFITHQRTHIAATSGVRESFLHVAQMVQNGAPVRVALFLEINALTVVLLAGLLLVHALTAYVDIRYTSSRTLEMSSDRVAPNEITVARLTPPKRNAS